MEFMPALSRPPAGGVRIKPAIYHDTFCPNERYILFLPRTCFLLFQTLDSSPVFIFFRVALSSVLHDILFLRGTLFLFLSRYFVSCGF